MKLSANHIVKIFVFSLLLLPAVYAQQDTTQKKADTSQDSAFVMSKSPWGAVLRSAVLPGYGQIYTESYWKAPVIWGLAGWLIYNWNYNNRQYKDLLGYFNKSGNTGYLSNAKFYQDQRDLFAIYMGLTYILNMVDAYIDAQLFDFSVTPDPVTNTPVLNMRVNF